MKFTIIAIIFSIAQARNIEQNCDGVIVHNINHKQEVLKDDLDSPYQLAIDYDTNILYFSYSSHTDNDIFKSAYINLKTNKFKNIPGIAGGFANAVDSKQHLVYLGGRDGIYKFDFESEQAVHVPGSGHNIWQLFYKDHLYFTTYPDEKAYTFIKDVAELVPELENTRVLLVALDKNDNIYFTNSSGLFLYKKEKQYISSLGDYNINGFTADINGNLFFSTPSGLYTIDGENKDIQKLTDLSNVYGIAIEADGSIIYASQTSIVRLAPTKSNCYLNEKELITLRR